MENMRHVFYPNKNQNLHSCKPNLVANTINGGNNTTVRIIAMFRKRAHCQIKFSNFFYQNKSGLKISNVDLFLDAVTITTTWKEMIVSYPFHTNHPNLFPISHISSEYVRNFIGIRIFTLRIINPQIIMYGIPDQTNFTYSAKNSDARAINFSRFCYHRL